MLWQYHIYLLAQSNHIEEFRLKKRYTNNLFLEHTLHLAAYFF